MSGCAFGLRFITFGRFFDVDGACDFLLELEVSSMKFVAAFDEDVEGSEDVFVIFGFTTLKNFKLSSGSASTDDDFFNFFDSGSLKLSMK